MSIGVPTLQNTNNYQDVSRAANDNAVSVPVVADTGIADPGTLMWQQIDNIVATSLKYRGARHTDGGFCFPSSPFARRLPECETTRVVVAPGIVVSSDEYERRFQGIDLDTARKRMSHEVFKVFVRYLGIIPGDPRLNISEISSIPE